MAYFNIMRTFAVVILLTLTYVPVQAETLYTRLECETMDGATHVWIHSKAIAFDDGKPAIESSPTFDSQEMAARLWADLHKVDDSATIMAEHAEPFRKTLLEKYGLLCNSDVGMAFLKKSLAELGQSSKLADGIWIATQKKFNGIDLEIRVIAYPEK